MLTENEVRERLEQRRDPEIEAEMMAAKEQKLYDDFVAQRAREKFDSRVKVYHVDEQQVLMMGFGLKRLPQFIDVNAFEQPDLPEGFEIRRVWHEPYKRAFAFLVWHPDFEPTIPSASPPWGDKPFFTRRRIFERGDDGRYTLHE